MVERASRFRPGKILSDPMAATRAALRSLARRWPALAAEIETLERQLAALVQEAAPPAFLAEFGVGPDAAGALLAAAGDNPDRLHTEAAFAARCGASPLDASSGPQQRHRLNRGGIRQANSALWRIVMVRLRWDHPETRAYVDRRVADGKTRLEAIRRLKRFLARRIWRLLTRSTRPTPTT